MVLYLIKKLVAYVLLYLKNLVAICSAIAKLEVKPGDSIPKRLIRPGTPCASSPCTNEIAFRPHINTI